MVSNSISVDLWKKSKIYRFGGIPETLDNFILKLTITQNVVASSFLNIFKRDRSQKKYDFIKFIVIRGEFGISPIIFYFFKIFFWKIYLHIKSFENITREMFCKFHELITIVEDTKNRISGGRSSTIFIIQYNNTRI